MSDDLEPIEPRDTLEMWLDRLESTRADETLRSCRYRLKPFVQWCESEGIDTLNDLASRHISGSIRSVERTGWRSSIESENA